MEKRSHILRNLPSKMYTVDSFLEIFERESIEDAEKWMSKQKQEIEYVKTRLREKYTKDELTDDEINLLMDIQIEKCLEYNTRAIKTDPFKDLIFILDMIDTDTAFFHNVQAIDRLVKFDSINDAISFALKYFDCTIWNELLECIKKNEINDIVISKIKKINAVNGKVRRNIDLNFISEWDGEISSLEFDSYIINSDELNGHASQQSNNKIAFYKYNEEVIIIKPNGDLYYSSVIGKGHPIVTCEMYEKEIEITYDMRKGNGYELYIKAATKLNSITILGAGEFPILYVPKDLSEDQKKVLYKLLINCDMEILKITIGFIDKNGDIEKPLCANTNGELSNRDELDSFIDEYLGRYPLELLNEYKEEDLHLEGTPLQQRETELRNLEKQQRIIKELERTPQSRIIMDSVI